MRPPSIPVSRLWTNGRKQSIAANSYRRDGPSRIFMPSSPRELGETKNGQARPTTTYKMLWPNTALRGGRTRHQDLCPSVVSFRIAAARQTNPAR
jgi:hypothetical protein